MRMTSPFASMTDKPANETLETVYAFLEAFMVDHGYAPSLREISARCFIGRSTVIHYLDRLEAQGRLRREEGKARSIVLTPPDENISENPGQMVGQMITMNKNIRAILRKKKEPASASDT